MVAKRQALSHPAQPRSNLAMKLRLASNCIAEALVPVLDAVLPLDPRCASPTKNQK